MTSKVQRAIDYVRREAFLEFAGIVVTCDSGELLEIRRQLANEFKTTLLSDTRRYMGLRIAIATVRCEHEARMEENL